MYRMMKSLIPVVMAGIIGVYGLVVSVLIANDLDPTRDYSLFAGLIEPLIQAAFISLLGYRLDYQDLLQVLI